MMASRMIRHDKATLAIIYQMVIEESMTLLPQSRNSRHLRYTVMTDCTNVSLHGSSCLDSALGRRLSSQVMLRIQFI